MINELFLFDFRNQTDCTFHLSRVSFFYGANSSGKTTILEALYYLKYHSSFRAKYTDQCIRLGQYFFGLRCSIGRDKLFAEKLLNANPKLKINGDAATPKDVSNLMPEMIILSEHEENLITGRIEVRRKFIDEMFHVEPRYKKALKSYQKALETRNHLLKISHTKDDQIWLAQMVEFGKTITEMREYFFSSFVKKLKILLSTTKVSEADMIFYRGFEGGLADAFTKNKELDLLKRSTSSGPHKADIYFEIGGHRVEHIYSRGQLKLLNLVANLLKAEYLLENGKEVLLLIDDYFVEMDSLCLDFFRMWLKKIDAEKVQLIINAVSKQEFERMNYLGFEQFAIFEMDKGTS